MSTIVAIRLCIDFGLLVLIWMVQRVVYPSFLLYTKKGLVNWHKQYTPAIACIVGPLMILQLGLASYQCILHLTVFSIGYLGIVILLWVITFYTFVPLHRTLKAEDYPDNVPQQLVHKNWWRTVLWTLLFILSMVQTQLP